MKSRDAHLRQQQTREVEEHDCLDHLPEREEDDEDTERGRDGVGVGEEAAEEVPGVPVMT